MQLVPFHEKWAGSETKLDLKAIYRRPSVHGGFTLTSPLPLRRHLDWTRKGFDYVTLSSIEDVQPVLATLSQDGIDLPTLRKSYDARTGVFDTATYLKTERQKDDAFVTELQAKVDKFGMDAVTEMMRVQDPAFVMPATVKAAGARKAPARAEA